MDEAKETIGTALLPAMTGLANVASTILPPAFQALGTAIGGISSAIGFLVEHSTTLMPLFAGLAAALGVGLVAALMVVIPLLWAKAAAWTAIAIAAVVANAPFLLIVAAIALLVAGIVLLIQHWDSIVAKFPALGVAADAVKAALQAIADWFTGTFVPAFMAGITAVVDGFRTHWGTIAGIVGPILEAVSAVIEAWWGAVEALFEGGLQIIQGIFDIWAGIFTGDWERVLNGIQSFVQGWWTILTGVFTAALEAIKALWQGAFEFLDQITGGKLGDMLGTVTDVISQISGVISGFVGDLWNYAWEIGSAVYTAGEAFFVLRDWIADAISGAIGWIDSLIQKIRSIPKPDLGGLGGVVGKVNPFAKGGRNISGGLSLVGEEGPELLNLPRGTDIYSAGETASMIRNGMRTKAEDSAPSDGIAVTFHNATVIATNKEDARRGAGDIGWAVMRTLRAKGAA
jgi:phage-related protein